MARAFIAARWFTPGRTSAVDVCVWHTGETQELATSAEGMGRYFASLPATRRASAHHGCDSDSTVDYVHEHDVAYAAPGANHDGVHVELSGRAAQTAAGWNDDYSQAMLREQAVPLGAEITERHRLLADRRLPRMQEREVAGPVEVVEGVGGDGLRRGP